MKKSLTKFFSLIAVAGVVFFSSCGSKDDAVTPNAPTVTVTLAGNGSLEAGDVATYSVVAAIPGGFQAGSTSLTVGTGTATPGQLPTGAINAGDTTATFNLTFTVPADATVGDMYKFSVTIIDNSGQSTTSSEATFTVAATGQGGGGTAPLVKGSATIQLGTQSNPTDPSYLSTATQTDGTIGKTYKSSEAVANQSVIDMFFGTTKSNGSAEADVSATAVPSVLSPSEVNGNGAGKNGWTNDITGGGRTTKFALVSGLTDLNVSAINVENNINTTSGQTAIGLTKGSFYSFVNQDGKKGYLLIKDLTGSAGNYTVQIEFVVQQ